MTGRGHRIDRSDHPEQASASGEFDRPKDVDRDGLASAGSPDDQSVAKVERSPMAVAAAGLELGVVIAGLTLLGWWLDGRFGWRPWLMVTGLILGLVGGTYNVWKVGRSFFDS